MSLVTACPSCGVLFKVAPDQLLISEGWVRCGKCQTVFDASLSLQPQLKTIEAVPPTELLPEAGPQNLVSAAPEAPEPPSKAEPALEDSLVSSKESPLCAPAPIATAAPYIKPSAKFRAFQLSLDVPSAAQSQPLVGQRSWMLKVLFVLALLLSLTITVQVVLYERNEIVSREPRAKPWLLALCKPFNCQLEALKRIQSVVIDNASFAKISPDIYQLSLILKNTSKADLQLPWVELTLINSLDQPLLRRVFSVDELRVQSSALLSLSELPLSLSFTIKTGELSDRIAGYRVLVFYP